MIRTEWRTTALACTLAAAIGALTAAPGPRADAQSSSSSPSGNPNSTQACPSSNAPNELVLVAGTPQTAQLDTTFTGLEVQLANTNGCAITTAPAGTPVTFTAPATGASATFAASGANVLTVGADATGSASAQAITANDTAGSYTVTARSAYGTVSFSLTNSAAGIPATITPLTPTRQRATIDRRYAHRLAVRVLDSDGTPVASAAVMFTLRSSGGANQGGSPSGSESSGAGATFDGGTSQTTETTNAHGIATSPAFSANDIAGAFTATATATGATGIALFGLDNRAGPPFTIAAGIGAAQSTPTGVRFAIPLAVTITDAHGNSVQGVAVMFAAPSSGPSGTFAVHSTDPATTTVVTDGRGIAVAPAFTANSQAGGYIVTATVKDLRPAAFALVNDRG